MDAALLELRRIQVACSLHGGTRPLAGEGKYHHQARRQRSGGNPLYSHHEEFTGHGGNRGSRQVPSFVDRQAHFDNADHHEGHDTEHSIRHCEADLHERRSGAQYPEFQHIHDRRRHRKRADRLYFEQYANAQLAAETAAKAAKLGIRVLTNARTGKHTFPFTKGAILRRAIPQERALYLFAGVRQHRGTGIHEQR